MKNRIWVGMNDVGSSYQSDKELAIAKNGNVCEKVSGNDLVGSDKYKYDIYNLNLKPLEIVEVIIDTETQKYEVVRPREVGWYLGVHIRQSKAVAFHWNGLNFNDNRKNQRETDGWQEDEIKVLCKLPDNEHLRSLE